MGPDCSLPVAVPVADDGVDHGTRCTLGEYVRARWALDWASYCALKAAEGWGDELSLFAVSAALQCTVYVCSKTFPYPEFFCQFGDSGPCLLLGHWQQRTHQFRSLLRKDHWEVEYARLKRERGITHLRHRLYAGMLRYQERSEETIEHCRMEIAEAPLSLVGHHTWAIVLSDNFRAEEAMQHYLCQLLIQPDHPHSYNGIGTTLHDQRRYEDAIFYYQVQLLFNPMNKYSHLNLSLAYARLRRFDEAEREHRIQLRLHPTDRNSCDYFLELLNDMRKPEDGAAYFRALVEREPWRNEWRINLARALSLTKDYQGAAQQLQLVLERNRNDSRALVGLAELFERNGFYERASRLLQRLLDIFPRHPRVRSFLGDCLVKQAQYEDAERVLLEQIRLFPVDSEAYSRMAELHAQRGDINEAIAMYKKARAVDPTDPSSLFNVGLCYLDLQNFPEARAYFQQHLAENPNDPMSLLEIANTYYATGELEASIRHYRSVLEVKPDHHDCRAWLASTLAECQRRLEAIAEFETLVRVTGRHSYHFNISYLYGELSDEAHAQGDADKAEQYLKLSNLHAQLETGVRREFVERFAQTGPRPMPVHSVLQLTRPEVAWVLREEPLPTGTVEWTPEIHPLCSRLARAQGKDEGGVEPHARLTAPPTPVFTFLLLVRRAEQAAGYPFPRPIAHRIIREMLAPPTAAFVGSLVGPKALRALCDERVTACMGPLRVPVEHALHQLESAKVDILHSFVLYWPKVDGANVPLKELPADARADDYGVVLYVTVASRDAFDQLADLPDLVEPLRLSVSPAELLHVPFDSAELDPRELHPYDGAVALFCHQRRNRAQCEGLVHVMGEADHPASCRTVAAYVCGDEAMVKGAIHVLLSQAKKGDPVAAYNAVVTICLLLVKLGPATDWGRHFEANSEFALILTVSVVCVLDYAPCGSMLYNLALILLGVASDPHLHDPAHRTFLLDSAWTALDKLQRAAPQHPCVLYSLAEVHALRGGPPVETLELYRRASARFPGLGNMEAAGILLGLDRRAEAFVELEHMVAVDPYRAYAVYAGLLQEDEERRAARGQARSPTELRGLADDIRRFFEVHHNLRQAARMPEDEALLPVFERFAAWEAGLHLAPPPGPPARVDFVPRVPQTPFGVGDDFEAAFL